MATQMNSLAAMIEGDFKKNVAMGKEAGYLPPVQSIRAQVMNGTLLTSDTPGGYTPPKPFDPDKNYAA
eukprot:CAMPEP_0179458378 /NCGR_PEP_ID=MMETSP0799-20121207/41940_1 /TAXON_ID=46947 /ORGANISM="Geminigera cryophila, Strain CCMP2564" /LENGTH=67 /DNA_ID=CAMNT_0021259593 /DNA_START=53 /DNA_END=256 /DNA_ORIENTATION=-